MEMKKSPARQKSPSVATADGIDITLRFFCNGTCQIEREDSGAPPDDPVHMSPGDRVELKADGVDVKIKFKRATSPFVNPAKRITIPKDTSVIETVAASADGSYVYEYSCANPRCPTPEVSPEMIVP
jgi:hypothetical protein